MRDVLPSQEQLRLVVEGKTCLRGEHVEAAHTEQFLKFRMEKNVKILRCYGLNGKDFFSYYKCYPIIYVRQTRKSVEIKKSSRYKKVINEACSIGQWRKYQTKNIAGRIYPGKESCFFLRRKSWS